MSLAVKTVLVTGAGGSIGSVLCERIAREGAKRLKVLSLTENGLYTVTRRLRALGTATEIEPILGSVCDSDLVLSALVDVDVVIHAAAHKHVPICEQNPIEAVKNNVFGTETLLKAAQWQNVPRFVLVSSDKAVRPVSVMGATKRVAELLVQKAAVSEYRTECTIVRFGNVLDSAGSVLPLWREQLAKGGPITITDPRCERYFMSIPDACELIVGALSIGPGTYVFDMGKPQRMADIAQRLIVSSGMPCEIQYIGLRLGEKLEEELFTGEVAETAHPRIYRVLDKPIGAMHLLDDLRSAVACRASNETVRLLSAIAAVFPESQIAAA